MAQIPYNVKGKMERFCKHGLMYATLLLFMLFATLQIAVNIFAMDYKRVQVGDVDMTSQQYQDDLKLRRILEEADKVGKKKPRRTGAKLENDAIKAGHGGLKTAETKKVTLAKPSMTRDFRNERKRRQGRHSEDVSPFLASNIQDFDLEEAETLESNEMNVTQATAYHIVPWKHEDLRDVPGFCPKIPPHLDAEVFISFASPTFEELEKTLANLAPGGHYSPPDCIARSAVAVVVPYRERDLHLRAFLSHIHPFLQKQQLNYTIYIVEQAPPVKFNRAMLMNIGFVEALKEYKYSCVIFHDVDLLPEDERNLYTCSESPRHMSSAVDVMAYKLPYATIFGGAVAFRPQHFQQLNGYSNYFFGWGGEDDDLYNRLKFHGLNLVRYNLTLGRYRMIRHKKDNPSNDRFTNLFRGHQRFKSDGLNSLKYKLIRKEKSKLFTWIYVVIHVDMIKISKTRQLPVVSDLNNIEYE